MNKENALKLRASYKKETIVELVQTIKNQDDLVAYHYRSYQRSGNFTGHGAIEFRSEMLEALREKILEGEAKPDVFIGLDRFAMYEAVKKELQERQEKTEAQTKLENQEKIEKLDDIDLLTQIKENRLENKTTNPAWLSGCEFELAKRILNGEITSAPDGFEDTFQEFQLAIESELAKANQVDTERETSTENK